MSAGGAGKGGGRGGKRPAGARGKTTRVLKARGRTVSQPRWLRRQLTAP